MPTSEVAELQQQVRDLQTQVAANEKLREVRYEADQKAISTALAENNERLKLLNESRKTIEDLTHNLANRLMAREEIETRFNSIIREQQISRESMWTRIESRIDPIPKEIGARIESLAKDLDQIQRPNKSLLISLIGTAAILIGGLWFILGLQINDRTTPLALSIEQLRVQSTNNVAIIHDLSVSAATSTSSDVNSRTDREQLNERVKSLESLVSTGRAARAKADAETTQKLVEVETQLKGATAVVNLMKDDVHQMIGVLWSKTFPGVTLPDKNYRPTFYKEGPP
jgi:hypothetical protein